MKSFKNTALCVGVNVDTVIDVVCEGERTGGIFREPSFPATSDFDKRPNVKKPSDKKATAKQSRANEGERNSYWTPELRAEFLTMQGIGVTPEEQAAAREADRVRKEKEEAEHRAKMTPEERAETDTRQATRDAQQKVVDDAVQVALRARARNLAAAAAAHKSADTPSTSGRSRRNSSTSSSSSLANATESAADVKEIDDNTHIDTNIRVSPGGFLQIGDYPYEGVLLLTDVDHPAELYAPLVTRIWWPADMPMPEMRPRPLVGRGLRLSFMFAVCRRGLFCFKLKDGAFNGDDFLEWA
mgnify:CR=1 FL=1